jgi:hypothetical protein
MYMAISDGRGFPPNAHLYLICRLFWCRETMRFESSSFNWTLNQPFTLNSGLVANMRHNFMIIEAWQKSTPADSLVATLKLPLHEFHVRFADVRGMRELLSDSTAQPVVGVDGWVSALDPFTGRKAGEINVLLAMGSADHVLNLQKRLFDTARLKFNAIATAITSEQPKFINRKTEHCFTIGVDNIKGMLFLWS